MEFLFSSWSGRLAAEKQFSAAFFCAKTLITDMIFAKKSESLVSAADH